MPTSLTVTFTFFDEHLIALSLYEDSQGLALYSVQPPAGLRDATSGLLQRYQTHTGDSQIAQMRSMLETVEVTSNTTKTVDNLTMEVNIKGNRTVFTWSNTVNGASYSQLKLRFQDGAFASFYDDRSSYKLGSAEVNISEEDAVNIALQRVESFSYMHDNKEISNFDIVKEQIRSHTGFLNRTERFVMYPCYIVDIPLDRTYPGSVSYIEVKIWADSGKVVTCEALGYGLPSEYYDTSPAEENDSSENTQTNNIDTLSTEYITAACVAIAITITIVASVLVLRKKKKCK